METVCIGGSRAATRVVVRCVGMRFTIPRIFDLKGGGRVCVREGFQLAHSSALWERMRRERE